MCSIFQARYSSIVFLELADVDVVEQRLDLARDVAGVDRDVGCRPRAPELRVDTEVEVEARNLQREPTRLRLALRRETDRDVRVAVHAPARVQLGLAVPGEDEESHPPTSLCRGERPLFCIGNAGRSQMAHAFLERAGGHEVRSAGSRAEQTLHPEVVAAMAEIGYDLSDRTPRQLEPQADAAWADVVVTMGCGDVCPVLPGTTYVDWGARGSSRPAARARTRAPRRDRAAGRRAARQLDSSRSASA